MPDTPMTPDREQLRAAFVAALDTAHKTEPCSCGSTIWASCYHPDLTGRSHSERRADAVLAVRDAEVDRLRARNAELEAAACRCYDPIDHEPECGQATVTWQGVTYNVISWYRDAEGVWWMACGTDGQGQPLMRVRNDASNEPVPVSEVESDYGPLYRSDNGPDELRQTETF